MRLPCGVSDGIKPFKRFANYSKCAELLGRSPNPSEPVASAIVSASEITGVDSTLLAVTWQAETSFAYHNVGFGFYSGYGIPNNLNPDPKKTDVYNVDAGPLQVNYRVWWATKAGRDVIGNLDEVEVFGLNKLGVPFGPFFRGVPFMNVLAGGKILKHLNDRHSRRDAAGYYTSGEGKNARKEPNFINRTKQWDNYNEGYDKFFQCLSQG